MRSENMTGPYEKSILIVTAADSMKIKLRALIAAAIRGRFVFVPSCGAARREMNDRSYDIVIIDSPLTDENGLDLAFFAAENSAAGIMLLTRGDSFGALSSQTGEHGVIAVQKPLQEASFVYALNISCAIRARLLISQKENEKLLKKIADMKLLSRAKLLLIENKSISEKDAHEYIEKKAMDTRRSKREICAEIIGTYSR